MSAIRDITSIDLSNMNTLEGKRSIEVVVEATNAHLLTPVIPLPTASPRVARTARQMHRSRQTRLDFVQDD